MNKLETLARIKKLHTLFEEGKIKTLDIHEVHPDLPLNDRLNYIYFTLPVSINFQRSSPAMWQSAYATYHDPETNYLFYPEKTILESREKVQKDLLKYKLSLQKNKHTDIWLTISRILNENFENDPRNLFSEGEYDVVKVLELITSKYNIPYLRGLKLSNYWLYILSKFTDIKLKNVHRISIIPDTHVIQSTIKLGITPSEATPDEIVNVWYDLLDGFELTPVQMHSVLWNWSRNDFKPEV